MRSAGPSLGQGNGSLPGNDAVIAANGFVRDVLNQQFPASLQIDDVTRLPFIVGDATGADTVSTSARGKYGLVNIAFSKQAAMYDTQSGAPTLLAVEQLSRDLIDGRLDARSAGQSVAPAGDRTYDPHTLTSELTSALAQQSQLYGNSSALASVPSIVAFGNVRYDSYYFDAKIGASGNAATIAVATESSSTRRTPGQVETYVQPQADRRGFMVYGNMGSGALFVKTDSRDSTSQTLVIGDNLNGELGTGSTGDADQARAITLPGVLTHAAGGFGHTVLRLADGRVYAIGDNAYGQLGSGQSAGALPSAQTPRQVALPAGALAVAAANASAFALLEDGRVYSWGSSWGFGTLGDGSADGLRSTPAPVLEQGGRELTDVVQISARDNDVIALKADGSVWTWGSFSQQAGNELPRRVTPGYTVATRISGLPAGIRVRKVLTEQGLFIAVTDSTNEPGAVYSWGIHFDITANAFLFDLQPVRVLNLPPIRDVMPGGFQGYGQRPFDRLTAMGVDYNGRFWKVRGRVAERYDPDNPTAQRRPQGQAPRPDCASCHTVRPADTLPPHTTGPACVLPSFKLRNNVPVLVNDRSDCTGCHNGGRLADGRVLAPLTCVPTGLPPAPAPTTVQPATGRCALPAAHPPAPAGTFCATCHNSVIAAALTCSADEQPLQPPSSTIALVLSALDNAGPVQGALASGAITDDDSPLLQGSASAALVAGESVRILQNATDIGAATPAANGGWSFQLSDLADGNHRFTAQVQNAGGARGAVGAPAFDLTVATGGATNAATITGIEDNAAPLTGIVASGSFTNDRTPTLSGTLNAALGTGERIRIRRQGPDNGTSQTEIVPPGGATQWTYTDSGLPAARAADGNAFRYTAVVVNANGIESPPQNPPYLIVLDETAPAAPTITDAIADRPVSNNLANRIQGSITNSLGGTMDADPVIVIRVPGGRAGDQVEVTVNGQQTLPAVAARAVSGVTAYVEARLTHAHGIDLSGNQSAALPASLSYTARVSDQAGNQSPASAPYAINVGYFSCGALRVIALEGGSTSFRSVSSHADANGSREQNSCGACHEANTLNGRPRIKVPTTGADQYWCSFAAPPLDIVGLPR